MNTGAALLGHVDDPPSVQVILQALRDLHGEGYDFAVEGWQGETRLFSRPDQVLYLFVMEAEAARIRLRPGERVRGPAPDGPYRAQGGFVEVTAAHEEAIWPGDVVCVDASAGNGVVLEGRGTAFQVIVEATAYPAPRLAMLRHLESRPGGCAAYPGAFRREALPPERAPAGAEDRRGPNRVNEHTLDMRPDRHPLPVPHYHGLVPCGSDRVVNHSETALVLPRSAYSLPLVNGSEEGEVLLFPQPSEEPSDCYSVPVRPGSVLVTPATEAGAVGHCFRNAFAMLVAIPGFVAPYQVIGEPGTCQEATQRQSPSVGLSHELQI